MVTFLVKSVSNINLNLSNCIFHTLQLVACSFILAAKLFLLVEIMNFKGGFLCQRWVWHELLNRTTVLLWCNIMLRGSQYRQIWWRQFYCATSLAIRQFEFRNRCLGDLLMKCNVLEMYCSKLIDYTLVGCMTSKSFVRQIGGIILVSLPCPLHFFHEIYSGTL